METDTTDTKANGARKSTSGHPCLVYSPREDATPEGELSALVTVYKFVLECHEPKKNVGTENGGDGGEEAAERNGIGGIPSEERP
jgi:hypothetical protein